jgi:hypothetical protein
MTTAKRHIATLIFTLFILTSFGQKSSNDYLLAFLDSSSGKELWGFKTTSGHVIIKPKYEVIGTDTMFAIAFVTLNFKWFAIDRQDNIVLTPYIFDNGPDYVQEGLFRYVENNKIGFANMQGQKVIQAKFDFASIFNNGLAAFNIGGQLRKIDDEHSSWQGGLWGFIDRNGQTVIEPKFTNVYDFSGKYCEAWTQDNKHILIDKKGDTFKVLTK